MTQPPNATVGSDTTSSGFNPETQNPPIGFGVWGDSGNADGVIGSTATGTGVFGQSTAAGTAVQGSSDNGIGVEATSAGGTAALHALFGSAGAAVTEAFLATSTLAADFQGNVAIGLSAGEQAQRPLHVEGPMPQNPGPGAGAEIHSGGSGGGYSFADRTAGTPAGSFVESPTKGERWVWYAQNGTARLWSGADVMSASTTGVSIAGALTAAQRMQVQQGPQDPSAGIWFFQSTPKNNQGFVGMSDDTHIGLYGNTGAGWGLIMDTGTGVVSIPHGISIPNLSVPNLTVTNDQPAGSKNGTAVCAESKNGVGVYASGTTAVNAIGPSQFTGNVTVSGTITGQAKNCLIDHPSDPENRTLTHACVESDERSNVYSGNIALDENGEARVTLPKWVAAFNTDFRYQLTCIGQSAPVYVAQEVRDDAFSIAGGTAGMKVSWQVTGVRNDAWAQANPLVVEQEKPEDEKGFFLSPEAFGHDHTRHVQYKRLEHLIEAYPRQAEHAIAAYVAGRTSR
jgi:hypothetical protein